MEQLIHQLFQPQLAGTVYGLHRSGTEHERQLLQGEIAKIAEDRCNLFSNGGSDWLLCVVSKPMHPEAETMRIFCALSRFLTQQLTFEGVLGSKSYNDLADNCFVMLSLFKDFLAKQTRTRGAPTSQFYNRIGKRAFIITGFKEVADNFDFWTDYIEGEFMLVS